MKINEDFKDILIVDEKSRIEYFNIGSYDFFDLRPEELIGKTPSQLYENLDDESSTLMRAINYGEEKARYTQKLKTKTGKTVLQSSDTYCIKDGEKVLGAIEFAYYDENKDILNKPKIRNKDSSNNLTLENIIGESDEIISIKKKIKKVSNLESPILLTGATGTGKEMIARIIHNYSKRSGNSFIYINCSAVPEELFEGIIFGTKKGSFTDAEEKVGLFQMADKGTLFLDEVDSMPLGVQGKILKAIEDKCIRPVGGNNEIYLDVKIIASCNMDIEPLLNSTKLRKDLYFRLSVIQFQLPLLKNRDKDVLLIANYYIKKFNVDFKKNVEGISDEVRTAFLKYNWPGNVRELRNILEGIFPTLEKNIIELNDVKERLGIYDDNLQKREWTFFKESKKDLKTFLEEYEKRELEEALNKNDGNIVKTVQELGISRQLLINKLKKYRL